MKITNRFLFLAITLLLTINTYSQKTNNSLKEIKGKVTYQNKPLADVNIYIKSTHKGTKTNTQGNYTINAKIGDLIVYSYVGFKAVAITVEDITSVLNIKMDAYISTLDEVVITKKIEKTEDLRDAMDIDIKTSFGSLGTINPLKYSKSLHYLDKNHIKMLNPISLDFALSGQFSNVVKPYPFGSRLLIRNIPATYDIDGLLYERDPGINFDDIEHLYIVMDKALVIVRTKNSIEVIKKKKEALIEKSKNHNYYKNDAVTLKKENAFSSTLLNKKNNSLALKEITGRVTYKNKPLADVNIIIKGSHRGTKTDSKGNYTINANIGDIIQYRFIGYKTVSIVVEDITKVLNIKMISKTNILDKVEIVANKSKGRAQEQAEKAEKIFISSRGQINPKKAGYSIYYIDGEDISPIYQTLKGALIGKVPGVRFSPLTGKFIIQVFLDADSPIWDIDGMVFDDEPPLDINNIRDIHIIKSLAGANLYGSRGRGGAIVVRTKYGSFDNSIIAKRNKIAEKSRNHNYYKDDAMTLNKKSVFTTVFQKTQKNNLTLKEIKGKVTYLNSPLADVNISIKNRGTRTNAKGNYKIKAITGEVIQYSYVGFKTISLIIEDVTGIINIKMIPKTTELDQVEVLADLSKSKNLKRVQKSEKKFKSSRGTIDPKNAGYAVGYVNGEDISPIYRSISEALVGKIPGARIDPSTGKFILKPPASMNTVPPVLWDIDGAIYSNEPYDLDLNQIKSINVIKSLAGTNKYGSAGAGGVVVIQTKSGSFDAVASKRKKLSEKYANTNYYDNDAVALNTTSFFTNAYTTKIQDFNNLNKAYAYYNEKIRDNIKDYDINISIAQKFKIFYKNDNVTLQILADVAKKYNKNAEVLKAIAYQFQIFGYKNQATKIYEDIFNLRPTYAQSYRDLANAYVENDQYKKGWRMYMRYLFKGNDVNKEGIGQTIYNEMEWLFFNRKNQTDIKEHFIPKNKDISEFRNDVRLVVEWNTSEAEFDLEFVNPEKRSYVFEHSLEKNENLITDEKKKGYSSKEFFIDDIGQGEWLVNITYKGNKKPEPTYFKVTQYLNWGKVNQTKKTDVYTFKDNGEKIQLIKLDNQVLMTSN